MFQDLKLQERKDKIEHWLSKRENRIDILTKAVEVCLRERDAANKARSKTFKQMKSMEEQAMIKHIEQLINNA